MFYCSMSRTISTFVSKTFIDGSILFNLLLLNIKFCQSIMWFKMILSLLSLNSLNKMNIIVRVCKNVLLSKPRSWRSKSLPKDFCPPTVKSRFLMDSTSFLQKLHKDETMVLNLRGFSFVNMISFNSLYVVSFWHKYFTPQRMLLMRST